MFGLSFEKLFLVVVIAGFVLGPDRLPGYAHQLAHYLRSVRGFVERGRVAAERDMGIPMARTDWESLDLRQYDPRRVISDALQDPPPAKPVVTEQMLEESRRVRPGQKYLITGASSHPRRILIESLPEGDPRRSAALIVPPSSEDVPLVDTTDANRFDRR